MDDQLSVRAGSNVGPVPVGLEIAVFISKKAGNVPLTKISTGAVPKDYLICNGKSMRGQYFGAFIANPTGSGDLTTVQLVYVDKDGNEAVLGSGSVTAGGVNSIDAGDAFLVPLPEGSKIIARITPDVGYTGGAVLFGGQYIDLLETASLFFEQDLGTDKRTVIAPVKGKTLLSFSSILIINMDSITHNVDTYINDGVSDVLVQGLTAVIPSKQSGAVAPLGNNLFTLTEGYSVKLKMQEAQATKRCFCIGFATMQDTPADEPLVPAP